MVECGHLLGLSRLLHSVRSDTHLKVDARFFKRGELPEEVLHRYQDVFEDLQKYDGSLILK